jgi:hypothetical protein
VLAHDDGDPRRVRPWNLDATNSCQWPRYGNGDTPARSESNTSDRDRDNASNTKRRAERCGYAHTHCHARADVGDAVARACRQPNRSRVTGSGCHGFSDGGGADH